MIVAGQMYGDRFGPAESHHAWAGRVADQLARFLVRRHGLRTLHRLGYTSATQHADAEEKTIRTILRSRSPARTEAAADGLPSTTLLTCTNALPSTTCHPLLLDASHNNARVRVYQNAQVQGTHFFLACLTSSAPCPAGSSRRVDDRCTSRSTREHWLLARSLVRESVKGRSVA